MNLFLHISTEVFPNTLNTIFDVCNQQLSTFLNFFTALVLQDSSSMELQPKIWKKDQFELKQHFTFGVQNL